MPQHPLNLSDDHRIVVTGLSLITPLGDDPQTQIEKMFQGESAISQWTHCDTSKIYMKIGGDMKNRSAEEGLAKISGLLPPATVKAAKKLISKSPWSTGHTVELALRAAVDCGFFHSSVDLERNAVIVAGTNINVGYYLRQVHLFLEEPDFIDPFFSVSSLDSDHAACASEALGLKGGAYFQGAACASGNLTIRTAMDEIRYHGMERVFAVGAILDPSMVDMHGLALVRAISTENFNDNPTRASRPFDVKREGFLPAQGGAVLVLESLATARKRGAKIYAEILGSEISSDANHLPNPSQEGQVRAMRRLLAATGVRPEEIDYVNAHATSTQLGDLVEIRTLKEVFGEHAYKLKINAPKSMLGHTCWSAALVEAATGLLQMQAGKLHPSVNIDELDPEVDLPIVRGSAEPHHIRMMLKNSFGFGGLNCVSLFRAWEENS